jgi:hypothetical protein
MGPLVIELEDFPYEMRQKGEQRQHKYSANPDQKIPRHLGIVNLFLVHALQPSHAAGRGI